MDGPGEQRTPHARMAAVRDGGELPPAFLQQLNRAATLPVVLPLWPYLQRLSLLAHEPDHDVGTARP